MKELKLAILGFGNVGRAFAELIIKNHQKILTNYGTDVKVVAIATKSRGNLIDENGLDLVEALEEIRETGRFENNKALTNKNNWDIIRNVTFDVLVELTPLNVKNGEPAISHIKEAFANGKGVVTANKGPIAWAYDQLAEISHREKVPFFYETTVMDGAPIFNMYDNCLRLAEVFEISGVLNTTTNYILGQLEEGISFEKALEKGKNMGFVESDPSLDIDGWDGAVKIAALANVLMGAAVTPENVERQGIGMITSDDIKAARTEGKTIKVMCRAKRDTSGRVVVKVAPEQVPLSDKMALVNGTTSAVSLITDMMGELTIFENNPNIYQTAYGVFSDLLRIIVGK